MTTSIETIAFGGGAYTFLWIIISSILNIIFAVGVYKAAKSSTESGTQTWFVGPWGWALATLIIGPLFAGVYFVVHHSSIGSFNDDALREVRQRRDKLKPEEQ